VDIPQLKLLAGRVRGLLQRSSTIVGHSQALDLVAALPGLRNWPEVMAFPQRVAATELDGLAARRLAFRLKNSVGVDFIPNDLLLALAPEGGPQPTVLHVWPGGPPAGVYVTTSSASIEALLSRYEEATDGGLVYAEQAGTAGQGSIDLGEYGLWSSGIDRLPSGTLIVVGPLDLDQGSWGDAAERVSMSCLHALNSDHRVAILVRTPTPERLTQDVALLARTGSEEAGDLYEGLAGLVSNEGELLVIRPFPKDYPSPHAARAIAGPGALPKSVRDRLQPALAARDSGIVLFGSSAITDHVAIDQVADALSMTTHAGPAARIMPRHRGTPAKDWLVPDAVKALPFLPSIASAYAQGYRRMIITPHYLKGEDLANYEDVLFLGGTYGHEVQSIALRLAVGSAAREGQVVNRLVAVHGMFQVQSRRGTFCASDLFIRGNAPAPISAKYEDYDRFLRTNRVLRWEDELTFLLESKAVSETQVRKAGGHSLGEELLNLLSTRRTNRQASRRASMPTSSGTDTRH